MMPGSNFRMRLPLGKVVKLDRREKSSVHFANLFIVINLYIYFNLYNLLNFPPRELQILAPNCGALEENSLISWISSTWSGDQTSNNFQSAFLCQGLIKERLGWSA